MDLPLEILNKISGYYPSPELTAAHKCNIRLAAYNFKLRRIKREQRELILENVEKVLDRYNFN